MQKWAQTGLQKIFWWLDKNQHFSATCETSSQLVKEVISLTSGRRVTRLSIELHLLLYIKSHAGLQASSVFLLPVIYLKATSLACWLLPSPGFPPRYVPVIFIMAKLLPFFSRLLFSPWFLYPLSPTSLISLACRPGMLARFRLILPLSALDSLHATGNLLFHIYDKNLIHIMKWSCQKFLYCAP